MPTAIFIYQAFLGDNPQDHQQAYAALKDTFWNTINRWTKDESYTEDIIIYSTNVLYQNIRNGTFEYRSEQGLWGYYKVLCFRHWKKLKPSEMNILTEDIQKIMDDTQDQNIPDFPLDFQNAFEECFSKLDSICQEAFQLLADGYKLEEIANKLGKSYNALKQKIFRCRKSLKDCLGRKGFDLDK